MNPRHFRIPSVPLPALAKLLGRPIAPMERYFTKYAHNAYYAPRLSLQVAITFLLKLRKLARSSAGPVQKKVKFRLPPGVDAGAQSHAHALGMTDESYYRAAAEAILTLARGTDLFLHSRPGRLLRGRQKLLRRFDYRTWQALQLCALAFNCNASDVMAWILCLYRANAANIAATGAVASIASHAESEPLDESLGNKE